MVNCDVELWTAKVPIFFKDSRESHWSAWRQCCPRSLDVDQIRYLETKRRIDKSLRYSGMKSLLVIVLLLILQLYLPNIYLNNYLNILDILDCVRWYVIVMCFIKIDSFNHFATFCGATLAKLETKYVFLNSCEANVFHSVTMISMSHRPTLQMVPQAKSFINRVV